MMFQRIIQDRNAILGIVILSLCAYLPHLPAHGHGLGLDEAQSVTIGERKITVSVKMTPLFIVDDLRNGSVEVRLKDAATNSTISHATFLITVDKGGIVLLSEQFHAHDGVLLINVRPADVERPIITGQKESLGFIGNSNSPLTVEAPLFLDGGLYHYMIEVLTFDRDDNFSKMAFDTYVSVGEEATHSVTNGEEYTFQTRTYFDKITGFQFYRDMNTIQFSMPLNWNMQFISQIPLLHVEVVIPKSLSQLMTSTYRATLNGVELPRNAIMTDDSRADVRFVHYMIPADRLLRIANEAEISTDTMGSVFTLEPLSVPVFPLDTLTNTEKFKIQLSWSPAVIEPGKAVKFIFNIRDPKNDETLTNSYYEFVLLQNGREIYRNSKIAVIGAEVEQFTFTEKHVGTVIVRLENINRTGEFTEYVISVVPEFPISMLVLVASLTLATLLAAQRYNAKP